MAPCANERSSRQMGRAAPRRPAVDPARAPFVQRTRVGRCIQHLDHGAHLLVGQREVAAGIQASGVSRNHASSAASRTCSYEALTAAQSRAFRYRCATIVHTIAGRRTPRVCTFMGVNASRTARRFAVTPRHPSRPRRRPDGPGCRQVEPVPQVAAPAGRDVEHGNRPGQARHASPHGRRDWESRKVPVLPRAECILPRLRAAGKDRLRLGDKASRYSVPRRSRISRAAIDPGSVCTASCNSPSTDRARPAHRVELLLGAPAAARAGRPAPATPLRPTPPMTAISTATAAATAIP